MRLAILGGTGRIGGHLLTQVLDAGHEVHVLARSPQALYSREALARAPSSQPVPAGAPSSSQDRLQLERARAPGRRRAWWC